MVHQDCALLILLMETLTVKLKRFLGHFYFVLYVTCFLFRWEIKKRMVKYIVGKYSVIFLGCNVE